MSTFFSYSSEDTYYLGDQDLNIGVFFKFYINSTPFTGYVKNAQGPTDLITQINQLLTANGYDVHVLIAQPLFDENFSGQRNYPTFTTNVPIIFKIGATITDLKIYTGSTVDLGSDYQGINDSFNNMLAANIHVYRTSTDVVADYNASLPTEPSSPVTVTTAFGMGVPATSGVSFNQFTDIHLLGITSEYEDFNYQSSWDYGRNGKTVEVSFSGTLFKALSTRQYNLIISGQQKFIFRPTNSGSDTLLCLPTQSDENQVIVYPESVMAEIDYYIQTGRLTTPEEIEEFKSFFFGLPITVGNYAPKFPVDTPDPTFTVIDNLYNHLTAQPHVPTMYPYVDLTQDDTVDSNSTGTFSGRNFTITQSQDNNIFEGAITYEFIYDPVLDGNIYTELPIQQKLIKFTNVDTVPIILMLSLSNAVNTYATWNEVDLIPYGYPENAFEIYAPYGQTGENKYHYIRLEPNQSAYTLAALGSQFTPADVVGECFSLERFMTDSLLAPTPLTELGFSSFGVPFTFTFNTTIHHPPIPDPKVKRYTLGAAVRHYFDLTEDRELTVQIRCSTWRDQFVRVYPADEYPFNPITPDSTGFGSPQSTMTSIYTLPTGGYVIELGTRTSSTQTLTNITLSTKPAAQVFGDGVSLNTNYFQFSTTTPGALAGVHMPRTTGIDIDGNILPVPPNGTPPYDPV